MTTSSDCDFRCVLLMGAKQDRRVAKDAIFARHDTTVIGSILQLPMTTTLLWHSLLSNK
jgi:hypothetical protein